MALLIKDFQLFFSLVDVGWMSLFLAGKNDGLGN
jgi:hypothetical protein